MIIYSGFNSSRKSKYQLITKIEVINGKVVSSKSSTSKKSQKFLNSLLTKYKYLNFSKFSPPPIKPLKKLCNKIYFPYQKDPTLDYLLLTQLFNKNKKEFTDIIRDYVSLIKKNKIHHNRLSKPFIKIFNNNKDIKIKEKCINVACIDLNFDNILYDKNKNKYTLIDYEWTFKFPVPYKYIIFRSLIYFYSKYQVYNPNNFIKFIDILKLIKLTPREEIKYLNYEYHLQKYVCGKKFFSHFSKNIYDQNYESLKQTIFTNNNFQNIVNKKNQTDKATTELNALKDSKLYKLWPLYTKLKKIFIPNEKK